MFGTPPPRDKCKLEQLGEDGSPDTPKLSKSARKRASLKAKLLSLASISPKPEKGSGKGRGSGKGKGKGKAQAGSAASAGRVPPAEWTKLCSFRPQGPPRCRFYNSSKGCTKGSDCAQEHLCLQCGADHSWFHVHGGA
jgi:hypothetical protein